jgi:hypothetical protein
LGVPERAYEEYDNADISNNSDEQGTDDRTLCIFFEGKVAEDFGEYKTPNIEHFRVDEFHGIIPYQTQKIGCG